MMDTAALCELLRRAVLTLAAVPDSDSRYRGAPRTAWPEFVRHARDAYGWAPARVKVFVPTRQDLTVYLEALSWLDWYRRSHGEETVRLFIAWCFGAPVWVLQERSTTNRRRPCSPETVRKRRNGMILAIAAQYPDATRKWVDNLAEVANFAAASNEDDELSSDLRLLPKPPKTWRSAPVPLSPAEQASAHVALEKRLKRNGSRALKRAARAPGCP